MSGDSNIDTRTVATATDLATFVRLVNTTTPDEPTSLDVPHLGGRHVPRQRPVHRDAGRRAGRGRLGGSHLHAPARVRRAVGEHRGPRGRAAPGIGARLLEAIAAVAAERGKGYLHITTSDERPEGVAFLAHRGFNELERYKMRPAATSPACRPSGDRAGRGVA